MTAKTHSEALVALNDPLLEPLIRTGGTSEEIEHILVGFAQPLAQRILSQYIASTGIQRADADDITSTINLRLVTKLQAVATSRHDAIQGFEKYVCALAYNAVSDHLRKQTSGRWEELRDSVAESVETAIENRQLLRALWREIRDLRTMQRKALLLNLRDGSGVNIVSLLVYTGVASFDDVAEVLGMPAEELGRIWHDLPYDDLRIGELLNVTRQQVINLRKSARQRLIRRIPR